MRCDVKKEGHVGATGRSPVYPPARPRPAAIRRNHGLPTASRHGIESAAFRFIAFERCCRQQLMIEATGRPPVPVPPERARYSREHRLVQTDPDMFE